MASGCPRREEVALVSFQPGRPSTFPRARRRRLLARLVRAVRGKDGVNELLALDEVQRRLAAYQQSYLGVRSIPVAQVVGTVDRSGTFDRDFLPSAEWMRPRWQQVEQAFPYGEFPAISVYQVGDAYFVSDGHHRVAIARQQGVEFIDAEITLIDTPYDLPADVDVADLIHMEQARIFMEYSGLARVRPEAVIEFSRPESYMAMLRHMMAYGYLQMQRQGRLLRPEEVAADWYDNHYLPALTDIREEGVHEAFPWATDGDLFLGVHERRFSMFSSQGASYPAVRQVAREALEAKHPKKPSPRRMRRITRQRTLPFRKRRADGADR